MEKLCQEIHTFLNGKLQKNKDYKTIVFYNKSDYVPFESGIK